MSGAPSHLTAFLVLALLLRRWPLSTRATAAAAWMYGIGLEGMQGLVGGRTMEWEDVAANTAGILLGLLLDSLVVGGRR